MDDPDVHICEFPGCGRGFSTKTEKGVHHRRAHPDWFDAQQTTVATKARWSEEETLLLARKEAELAQQGEKFLNQALSECFPERSFDSIKSKRRQLAYREAVKRILETIPADVDEGTNGVEQLDAVNFRQNIAEYLMSLPGPSSSL